MAQLTFPVVDGLIFAASRQRFSSIRNNIFYAADDLGPFLELCHFCADNVLPEAAELSWLQLSGLGALATAIANGRDNWISPDGGKIGFLRPKTSETEKDWNAFAVAAHKASLSAGISSSTTAQLIGALGEMRSNLHEHSHAIESGFIAFRARAKKFEFAVADHGIGVLRSLKSCGYYSSLNDNGEALRLMLTENVSRFGGPTRTEAKAFGRCSSALRI